MTINVKKSIALVITVIFFTTTVAWSAPAGGISSVRRATMAQYTTQSSLLTSATATPNTFSAYKLTVPEAYGTVNARFKGNDDFTVVLIEDAHMHYEAQKNISGILSELVTRYDELGDDHVSRDIVVGLEGSAGPIDLSSYAGYPQDVARDVWDYFLKWGTISGAEYCAATIDHSPRFIGIEDPSLYQKNRAEVLSITRNHELFRQQLKELRRVLTLLRPSMLPHDLIEFDDVTFRFRKNEISLYEYADMLLPLAERHHVPLDDYFYVLSYKDILTLKTTIIKEVLDDESSRLVQALVETLRSMGDAARADNVLRFLTQFRDGAVPARDFYSFLWNTAQSVDLMLMSYPMIFSYIEYLGKLEGFDSESLRFELRALSRDVLQAFKCDDDAMMLLQLLDDLYFIEAASELKVFREEGDEFRERSSRFSAARYVAFIVAMAARYDVDYELTLDVAYMDEVLPHVVNFYEYGRRRDRTLTSTFLSIAHPQGAQSAPFGIMVTGGYHTQGIAGILRSLGISYVIISPHITAVQSGLEELYFNRIKGGLDPLLNVFNANATGEPNTSTVASSTASVTMLAANSIFQNDTTQIPESAFQTIFELAREIRVQLSRVNRNTELMTNDKLIGYEIDLSEKFGIVIQGNSIKVLDINKLINAFGISDSRFGTEQEKIARLKAGLPVFISQITRRNDVFSVDFQAANGQLNQLPQPIAEVTKDVTRDTQGDARSGKQYLRDQLHTLCKGLLGNVVFSSIALTDEHLKKKLNKLLDYLTREEAGMTDMNIEGVINTLKLIRDHSVMRDELKKQGLLPLAAYIAEFAEPSKTPDDRMRNIREMINEQEAYDIAKQGEERSASSGKVFKPPAKERFKLRLPKWAKIAASVAFFAGFPIGNVAAAVTASTTILSGIAGLMTALPIVLPVAVLVVSLGIQKQNRDALRQSITRISAMFRSEERAQRRNERIARRAMAERRKYILAYIAGVPDENKGALLVNDDRAVGIRRFLDFLKKTDEQDFGPQAKNEGHALGYVKSNELLRALLPIILHERSDVFKNAPELRDQFRRYLELLNEIHERRVKIEGLKKELNNIASDRTALRKAKEGEIEQKEKEINDRETELQVLRDTLYANKALSDGTDLFKTISALLDPDRTTDSNVFKEAKMVELFKSTFDSVYGKGAWERFEQGHLHYEVMTAGKEKPGKKPKKGDKNNVAFCLKDYRPYFDQVLANYTVGERLIKNKERMSTVKTALQGHFKASSKRRELKYLLDRLVALKSLQNIVNNVDQGLRNEHTETLVKDIEDFRAQLDEIKALAEACGVLDEDISELIETIDTFFKSNENFQNKDKVEGALKDPATINQLNEITNLCAGLYKKIGTENNKLDTELDFIKADENGAPLLDNKGKPVYDHTKLMNFVRSMGLTVEEFYAIVSDMLSSDMVSNMYAREFDGLRKQWEDPELNRVLYTHYKGTYPTLSASEITRMARGAAVAQVLTGNAHKAWIEFKIKQGLQDENVDALMNKYFALNSYGMEGFYSFNSATLENALNEAQDQNERERLEAFGQDMKRFDGVVDSNFTSRIQLQHFYDGFQRGMNLVSHFQNSRHFEKTKEEKVDFVAQFETMFAADPEGALDVFIEGHYYLETAEEYLANNYMFGLSQRILKEAMVDKADTRLKEKLRITTDVVGKARIKRLQDRIDNIRGILKEQNENELSLHKAYLRTKRLTDKYSIVLNENRDLDEAALKECFGDEENSKAMEAGMPAISLQKILQDPEKGLRVQRDKAEVERKNTLKTTQNAIEQLEKDCENLEQKAESVDAKDASEARADAEKARKNLARKKAEQARLESAFNYKIGKLNLQIEFLEKFSKKLEELKGVNSRQELTGEDVRRYASEVIDEIDFKARLKRMIDARQVMITKSEADIAQELAEVEADITGMTQIAESKRLHDEKKRLDDELKILGKDSTILSELDETDPTNIYKIGNIALSFIAENVDRTVNSVIANSRKDVRSLSLGDMYLTRAGREILTRFYTAKYNEYLKDVNKETGEFNSDPTKYKAIALAARLSVLPNGYVAPQDGQYLTIIKAMEVDPTTKTYEKLVAEVPTGQGKTVITAACSLLYSFKGKGVFTILSSAFLAKEAQFQASAFELAGISVGYVDGTMGLSQKQDEYGKDITISVIGTIAQDISNTRTGRENPFEKRVNKLTGEKTPGNYWDQGAVIDEGDAGLIGGLRVDHIQSNADRAALLKDERTLADLIVKKVCSDSETDRITVAREEFVTGKGETARTMIYGEEGTAPDVIITAQGVVQPTVSAREKLRTMLRDNGLLNSPALISLLSDEQRGSPDFDVANALVDLAVMHLKAFITATKVMTRGTDYTLIRDEYGRYRVSLIGGEGELQETMQKQDYIQQYLDMSHGVTPRRMSDTSSSISVAEFLGRDRKNMLGLTGTGRQYTGTFWEVFGMKVFALTNFFVNRRHTERRQVFAMEADLEESTNSDIVWDYANNQAVICAIQPSKGVQNEAESKIASLARYVLRKDSQAILEGSGKQMLVGYMYTDGTVYEVQVDDRGQYFINVEQKDGSKVKVPVELTAEEVRQNLIEIRLGKKGENLFPEMFTGPKVGLLNHQTSLPEFEKIKKTAGDPGNITFITNIGGRGVSYEVGDLVNAWSKKGSHLIVNGISALEALDKQLYGRVGRMITAGYVTVKISKEKHRSVIDDTYLHEFTSQQLRRALREGRFTMYRKMKQHNKERRQFEKEKYWDEFFAQGVGTEQGTVTKRASEKNGATRILELFDKAQKKKAFINDVGSTFRQHEKPIDGEAQILVSQYLDTMAKILKGDGTWRENVPEALGAYVAQIESLVSKDPNYHKRDLDIAQAKQAIIEEARKRLTEKDFEGFALNLEEGIGFLEYMAQLPEMNMQQIAYRAEQQLWPEVSTMVNTFMAHKENIISYAAEDMGLPEEKRKVIVNNPTKVATRVNGLFNVRLGDRFIKDLEEKQFNSKEELILFITFQVSGSYLQQLIDTILVQKKGFFFRQLQALKSKPTIGFRSQASMYRRGAERVKRDTFNQTVKALKSKLSPEGFAAYAKEQIGEATSIAQAGIESIDTSGGPNAIPTATYNIDAESNAATFAHQRGAVDKKSKRIVVKHKQVHYEQTSQVVVQKQQTDDAMANDLANRLQACRDKNGSMTEESQFESEETIVPATATTQEVRIVKVKQKVKQSENVTAADKARYLAATTNLENADKTVLFTVGDWDDDRELISALSDYIPKKGETPAVFSVSLKAGIVKEFKEAAENSSGKEMARAAILAGLEFLDITPLKLGAVYMGMLARTGYNETAIRFNMRMFGDRRDNQQGTVSFNGGSYQRVVDDHGVLKVVDVTPEKEGAPDKKLFTDRELNIKRAVALREIEENKVRDLTDMERSELVRFRTMKNDKLMMSIVNTNSRVEKTKEEAYKVSTVRFKPKMQAYANSRKAHLKQMKARADRALRSAEAQQQKKAPEKDRIRPAGDWEEKKTGAFDPVARARKQVEKYETKLLNYDDEMLALAKKRGLYEEGVVTIKDSTVGKGVIIIDSSVTRSQIGKNALLNNNTVEDATVGEGATVENVSEEAGKKVTVGAGEYVDGTNKGSIEYSIRKQEFFEIYQPDSRTKWEKRRDWWKHLFFRLRPDWFRTGKIKDAEKGQYDRYRTLLDLKGDNALNDVARMKYLKRALVSGSIAEVGTEELNGLRKELGTIAANLLRDKGYKKRTTARERYVLLKYVLQALHKGQITALPDDGMLNLLREKLSLEKDLKVRQRIIDKTDWALFKYLRDTAGKPSKPGVFTKAEIELRKFCHERGAKDAKTYQRYVRNRRIATIGPIVVTVLTIALSLGWGLVGITSASFLSEWALTESILASSTLTAIIKFLKDFKYVIIGGTTLMTWLAGTSLGSSLTKKSTPGFLGKINVFSYLKRAPQLKSTALEAEAQAIEARGLENLGPEELEYLWYLQAKIASLKQEEAKQKKAKKAKAKEKPIVTAESLRNDIIALRNKIRASENTIRVKTEQNKEVTVEDRKTLYALKEEHQRKMTQFEKDYVFEFKLFEKEDTEKNIKIAEQKRSALKEPAVLAPMIVRTIVEKAKLREGVGEALETAANDKKNQKVIAEKFYAVDALLKITGIEPVDAKLIADTAAAIMAEQKASVESQRKELQTEIDAAHKKVQYITDELRKTHSEQFNLYEKGRSQKIEETIKLVVELHDRQHKSTDGDFRKKVIQKELQYLTDLKALFDKHAHAQQTDKDAVELMMLMLELERATIDKNDALIYASQKKINAFFIEKEKPTDQEKEPRALKGNTLFTGVLKVDEIRKAAKDAIESKEKSDIETLQESVNEKLKQLKVTSVYDIPMNADIKVVNSIRSDLKKGSAKSDEMAVDAAVLDLTFGNDKEKEQALIKLLYTLRDHSHDDGYKQRIYQTISYVGFRLQAQMPNVLNTIVKDDALYSFIMSDPRFLSVTYFNLLPGNVQTKFLQQMDDKTWSMHEFDRSHETRAVHRTRARYNRITLMRKLSGKQGLDGLLEAWKQNAGLINKDLALKALILDDIMSEIWKKSGKSLSKREALEMFLSGTKTLKDLDPSVYQILVAYVDHNTMLSKESKRAVSLIDIIDAGYSDIKQYWKVKLLMGAEEKMVYGELFYAAYKGSNFLDMEKFSAVLERYNLKAEQADLLAQLAALSGQAMPARKDIDLEIKFSLAEFYYSSGFEASGDAQMRQVAEHKDVSAEMRAKALDKLLNVAVKNGRFIDAIKHAGALSELYERKGRLLIARGYGYVAEYYAKAEIAYHDMDYKRRHKYSKKQIKRDQSIVDGIERDVKLIKAKSLIARINMYIAEISRMKLAEQENRIDIAEHTRLLLVACRDTREALADIKKDPAAKGFLDSVNSFIDQYQPEYRTYFNKGYVRGKKIVLKVKRIRRTKAEKKQVAEQAKRDKELKTVTEESLKAAEASLAEVQQKQRGKEVALNNAYFQIAQFEQQRAMLKQEIEGIGEAADKDAQEKLKGLNEKLSSVEGQITAGNTSIADLTKEHGALSDEVSTAKEKVDQVKGVLEQKPTVDTRDKIDIYENSFKYIEKTEVGKRLVEQYFKLAEYYLEKGKLDDAESMVNKIEKMYSLCWDEFEVQKLKNRILVDRAEKFRKDKNISATYACYARLSQINDQYRVHKGFKAEIPDAKKSDEQKIIEEAIAKGNKMMAEIKQDLQPKEEQAEQKPSTQKKTEQKSEKKLETKPEEKTDTEEELKAQQKAEAERRKTEELRKEKERAEQEAIEQQRKEQEALDREEQISDLLVKMEALLAIDLASIENSSDAQDMIDKIDKALAAAREINDDRLDKLFDLLVDRSIEAEDLFETLDRKETQIRLIAQIKPIIEDPQGVVDSLKDKDSYAVNRKVEELKTLLEDFRNCLGFQVQPSYNLELQGLIGVLSKKNEELKQKEKDESREAQRQAQKRELERIHDDREKLIRSIDTVYDAADMMKAIKSTMDLFEQTGGLLSDEAYKNAFAVYQLVWEKQRRLQAEDEADIRKGWELYRTSKGKAFHMSKDKKQIIDSYIINFHNTFNGLFDLLQEKQVYAHANIFDIVFTVMANALDAGVMNEDIILDRIIRHFKDVSGREDVFEYTKYNYTAEDAREEFRAFVHWFLFEISLIADSSARDTDGAPRGYLADVHVAENRKNIQRELTLANKAGAVVTVWKDGEMTPQESVPAIMRFRDETYGNHKDFIDQAIGMIFTSDEFASLRTLTLVPISAEIMRRDIILHLVPNFSYSGYQEGMEIYMPMDVYFEMFYARNKAGTEQMAYYLLHEYLEAKGVSHNEIAARESQGVRASNVRSLARVNIMNQILFYLKTAPQVEGIADDIEKETARTAIMNMIAAVEDPVDRGELEKLAFTLLNGSSERYMVGDQATSATGARCHLLVDVDVFTDTYIFERNLLAVKEIASKGLVEVHFAGTNTVFLERAGQYGFHVPMNAQSFVDEFSGDNMALGIVSETFDFINKTSLPDRVALIPVEALSFTPQKDAAGVMKVLTLDVIAARFVKYGVEGLNANGRMDMLHFGAPLLLRDTILQQHIAQEYKLAA